LSNVNVVVGVSFSQKRQEYVVSAVIQFDSTPGGPVQWVDWPANVSSFEFEQYITDRIMKVLHDAAIDTIVLDD
jgi:hypothetical protein